MSADDREQPEIDGLDELIEDVIEQARPRPSAEQRREEWQRVADDLRRMSDDMPQEALAPLETQRAGYEAGGLLLRRALKNSGIVGTEEDIADFGTHWGAVMLRVRDFINADADSTAVERFEALDQLFDMVLWPMIDAIDQVSRSLTEAETIAAVAEQEAGS